MQNLFNKKLTKIYSDGSFALLTETKIEDVIKKLAHIENLLSIYKINNHEDFIELFTNQERLKKYKSLGRIQTEINKPPTGKIRVNKDLTFVEISQANKKFVISNLELIELAEMSGLIEAIFDCKNEKK